MSTEISLLFRNLEQFLGDICQFMRKVNTDNLSSDAKREVNTIIIRATVELQHIAKIKEDSGLEEYVIMGEPEENADDTKSKMPVKPVITSPNVKIDDIYYPFKDFPAKQFSTNEKCGYILLKSKFIFGLHKLKNVYAGIHENWFLVYSSERDSKPNQMINLQFNKAETVTTKPIDMKSCFFCVTNVRDKTVFQFKAQTPKDKEQWVARINSCFKSVHSEVIYEIPHIYEDSNYDPISPTQTNLQLDRNSEEAIYQMLELDDPIPISSYVTEKKDPVPLEIPFSNPRKRTPLPPIPDSSSAAIPYLESEFGRNSFSDPEEEEPYASVINPTELDESKSLPRCHVKDIINEMNKGKIKPPGSSELTLEKPKIEARKTPRSHNGSTTKQILQRVKGDTKY